MIGSDYQRYVSRNRIRGAEIEQAIKFLKRGAHYIPTDLETKLIEQGVDVAALKSKYQ